MNQDRQNFNKASQETLMHIEQVKLLYGSLPLALISNLLLASLLLGVMWSVIRPEVAIGWIVFLCVAIVWRGGMYWFFRKHNDEKPPYVWLKLFRTGIFATGFLWGLAALSLFPSNDISHQVFLAFVLAGVSAGAITSLSADRISSLGFVLLALLPLVLNFVMEGGAMQLSMSMMVVLFLLFLTIAAGRMQSSLYENVKLRSEAIVQQDAMRDSEKRFRFMLETCPTAARIAKKGGHDVIFYNQSYTALINSTPDEVGGIDPKIYYADQEEYADILQRLDKGESIFERLVELNIPGAGKKWALASYLTMQYEGLPAVLGWFHDITEQIVVERMKSEFVSTVSHELRTPLTAISGSLGLVVSGVLGELPQQIKDMLVIANKNSLRLSALINDLLDIEKLSAGKVNLDMQTERVKPLIEEALDAYGAYGIERRVSLFLQGDVPDIYIRVDRHRMMQVLSNLLSNAIKYSAENGRVDVTVDVHDNAMKLTIKDQGAGIPDEFKHRIFEKFAQADSSDTRKKGGTGLGLAITRDLVQRMGGVIGFESIKGEGASFYVSFPLCAENA